MWFTLEAFTIKFFTAVNNAGAQKANAFVTDRCFRPSLKFASNESPHWTSFIGSSSFGRKFSCIL